MVRTTLEISCTTLETGGETLKNCDVNLGTCCFATGLSIVTLLGDVFIVAMLVLKLVTNIYSTFNFFLPMLGNGVACYWLVKCRDFLSNNSDDIGR